MPILWIGILLIGIGTITYASLEGWSWLDALYATIITITTVGYGDLSPQSVPGRIFAIFFTVIAISLGGYAITSLAAVTVEGRARKIERKHKRRRMKAIETMQDHFIICGAEWVGTRAAEEFQVANRPYVIIDPDEEKVKRLLLFSHPEYFRQKIQSIIDFTDVDLSDYEDMTLPEVSELVSTPYLLEDPTDDTVLVKANLARATGLIAAMADDRDNLAIVIGARALSRRYENEALRIMAKVDDSRFMRKLYLSGADMVRIPSVISGVEMATHMMHPEIGRWWYSRVGQGQTSGIPLIQINLDGESLWTGQTPGQIYKGEQKMILSVKRGDKHISPPPHDLMLKDGDVLILMSS